MAATKITGPILVTGGCGLLGHNIVKQLLADPTAGPITVVARSPKTNIFDGVTYVAGSITNTAFVEELFARVKPAVVIHAAAPRPSDASIPAEMFEDVIVKGTENLLNSSRNLGTQAFVLCSTVNVIEGLTHDHVKEDAYPYWKPSAKVIPYWRSKAQQEQLVLLANSDTLKTVSIRPCFIIGEQDHALVPTQIKAVAEKKTGIQLGDNKNLWDIVSTENAARAHLLAMHALLDSGKANGQVAGEAFQITNDEPIPFWDAQRIIWREAGDTIKPEDVKVIPKWLALPMAAVSEWIHFLSFADRNAPPELNKQVVYFCTCTNTYDISKAKRVLGYSPNKDTVQTLKDATRWELNRQAAAAAAAASVPGPGLEAPNTT